MQVLDMLLLIGVLHHDVIAILVLSVEIVFRGEDQVTLVVQEHLGQVSKRQNSGYKPTFWGHFW